MVVFTFLLINVFWWWEFPVRSIIMKKKAIDQRVRYTQKQCAVLSDQIVMNGFRNYNMSSLSDEAGENVFEVEQLANNLEGRILLCRQSF